MYEMPYWIQELFTYVMLLIVIFFCIATNVHRDFETFP